MLPLTGIRVLITRPRGQASVLADLLEQHGAKPILIPTIEIAPPASFCALDAALTSIRAYDWVIFTSANAVQAFAARAHALKLPPAPRRIAVIGPATSRAVVDHLSRQPDLMPTQYIAEALAEALTAHLAGASILLVRAAIARDTLPAALAAAGAHLTIATAYSNVVPPGSIDEIRRLFAAEPPDAITFTSGSTAINLSALLEAAGLEIPAATLLASIGPITSKVMRDSGFQPTVESPEATIHSLVESLAAHFHPASQELDQ